MKHLLTETVSVLSSHWKKLDDICYVETPTGRLKVDEFKLAANINYDNFNDTGECKIKMRLIGADWSLDRGISDEQHEYWYFNRR